MAGGHHFPKGFDFFLLNRFHLFTADGTVITLRIGKAPKPPPSAI